jgi:rhodanese-related sulfurtransferase
MQNNREFKDQVYGAFAQVTKSLSSPRRLELLDLLLQGPRSVDALAEGTAQPVASTSQHLQVLKRARVVETRRIGTRVEYRLAPDVGPLFVALRRLAEARSPELIAAKREFYARAGAPETIERAELQARMAQGSVALLDVRPPGEFDAGHIPGALNIPVHELEPRLHELPDGALVVATCRGPYCTFAADAVRVLRANGVAAVRFDDGVGEWAADGGVLEAS